MLLRFLLVLATVAVCALLWVAGGQVATPGEALADTAMLALPAYSLGKWLATDRRSLPVYAMITAAFWMSYGLPSLMRGANLSSLAVTNGRVLSSESLEWTVVLVLAALITMRIGMVIRIPIAAVHRVPPLAIKKLTWVRLWLLIGGASSLLGYNATLHNVEIKNLLVMVTENIPLIALSMIYRAWLQGYAKRIDKVACLTMLLGGLARSIVSGALYGVATLLLVILLTYIHERKRIPVMICSVGVTAFLFLHMGKGEYRNRFWYERGGAASVAQSGRLDRIQFWFSQSVQHWQDALASHEKGGLTGTLLASTIERSSLLEQTANVIEMTPAVVPYQHMRLYSFIFYSPIPRAIWPKKPEMSEATRFYQRAYLHMSEKQLTTTSITVGTLAEGYISYGIVGVLLVMVFEGCLLGLTQNSLLRGEAGPLWQGLGILWLAQILLPEAFMARLISTVIQTTLMALLAFLPGMVRVSHQIVALMMGAEPALVGVPNFDTVSEQVYRGGQPSRQGFGELARRGIKTIVNLRRSDAEQARAEERLVRSLGMRYVHVPMQPLQQPSEQEVSRALSVVNDPRAWPVFVHCAGGRDRTGVVIACYRIQQEHWSNEKALAEARQQGLRTQEQAKQNYILSYQPRPGKGP